MNDAANVSPAIITAYTSGTSVLIWSANEVNRLRTEHRMTGNAIGSLANHTQQNVVLGLPVVLLPEEATLLQQKGYLLLLSCDPRGPIRGAQEVKQLTESRERLVQIQVDRLKNNPIERRSAIETIKAHGKRRRVDTSRPDGVLGHLAHHASAPPAGGTTDNVGSTCSTKITQGIVDAVAPIGHVAKAASTLRQAARIAILTAEPPLHSDHLEESNTWSGQLPRAQGYRLAPLPFDVSSTPMAALRYRVFADLHAKGYWITPGVKFGGDFLVYPGDPHRYHAHFVAVVLPYRRTLSPLDIISFGRLGNVVKKALLLCSVSDATDSLVYTSFQWTGSK
eukprot:m.788727 g.788727  ORF g.788727 m.788727 type:complete len:337 (-) comp23318_c0_seq21:3032-4042(-)